MENVSFDGTRACKTLFTGAVSGVVSRTATAPLERVKIMRQVENNGGSAWFLLRDIWRKRGLAGWWRGNGINAMRIAPYNAIQLSSFHYYKDLSSPTSSSSKKVWRASALAGMTSVLACYPLDLVRSLISIDRSGRNVKDMVKYVRGKYGWRGFYKGLGVSMVGIVPYVGLNLTLFDAAKSRWQPHHQHSGFDAWNFALGGGCSLVAVSATYPLECVRRKMQLSGFNKVREYSGLGDCLEKTWRSKGAGGFYQGYWPCVFRVIPAMSIVMLVNEKMRAWLKF